MAQQKFLVLIDELRDCLPLQQVVTRHTDRASVLRVTCAYLETHGCLGRLLEERNQRKDQSQFDQLKIQSKIIDESSLVLQALDGFCLLVSKKGDVLYVTETAASHLGYSQVSVLGCHLSELISEEDWRLIRQLLEFQVYGEIEEMTASTLIGMNCRLPKRASGLIKHGKKAVAASAFLRFDSRNESSIDHIMFYCTTLESGCGLEILLDQHKFAIRLDLSFRIIFIESRACQALGYSGQALIDFSLYDLINGDDLGSLQHAHKRCPLKRERYSIESLNDLVLTGETGQAYPPILGLLHADGGILLISSHFILHESKRRDQSTITSICSIIGRDEEMSCHSFIQDGFKWRDDRLDRSHQFKDDWWTEGQPVGSHSSKYYAHTLAKFI